nr:hypothetical protein [Candidatus Sigynarchaeum springense]
MMGDSTRDKQVRSRITEKEQFAKERLLLDKERELIKRQASEIRNECQQLQDQYERQGKKPHVPSIKTREYLVNEFVDLKDGDGYSALLRNAITYCETHNGCPFYSDHQAEKDPKNDCYGVWIKMGATCQRFADRMKQLIKK